MNFLKPVTSKTSLKIERIDTFILQLPLADQTFFSSQAAFPIRNSLLVRITAEGGLIGWGEGGQYGPAEPVASCIDHVLAPRLIGKPIVSPIKVSEELYAFSRDFGQKGTYIEALSAIDIALWDLWGQFLGVPVSELLGGAYRSEVTAYATGCYYPEAFGKHDDLLKALEEEARTYASAGFSALKMKVGLLSVEQDAERLRVVRNAIGDDISLLVDANHAYNTSTAIRMARELERFDVRFFEEPVIPEDRAGYRRVRDATDVAIAGGEAEFTRFGFRDLFLGECIDIAQPDICVCGGFSEWMKIQALASTFGVAMVPHVWGSGIAVATALQAIATIPPLPHTANPVALQNDPVVEYDRKHNPLRDDLLESNFCLKNGRLEVPTGPGLGVTVNEDVLHKYAKQGTK